MLLDDTDYDRALQVLDRERPTPPEERRFLWMNRLVWMALALFLIWPPSVLWFLRVQLAVLISAVTACAGAGFLLLTNLSLVKRLVRASWVAHRLGLSRRLNVLTAGASSRRSFYTWTLLGLHISGYAIAFLGLAGIVKEVQRAGWASGALAASFMLFGVACVAVYPMERTKQRIGAVAALRTALVEDSPSGSEARPLASSVYDDVVSLDRVQIEVQRNGLGERSNRRSSHPAVRVSNALLDTAAHLPAEQTAQVWRVLNGITTRPVDRYADGAIGTNLTFEPVPGTPLEVAFRWDVERNEVQIVSLVTRRAFDSAAGRDDA